MMGHDRYSGGRHLRDSEEVEPPSVGLAKTLARYDFELGRLKTGTPARIDGKTIDWDILVPQPSEIPATPFSHLLQFNGEQPPMIAQGKVVTCRQTATNEETHKLVMKYEDTLPIYDGMYHLFSFVLLEYQCISLLFTLKFLIFPRILPQQAWMALAMVHGIVPLSTKRL
jgi:tRNA U34 5-carboxymethylaminomethyl modifying enzyme MnmG/GidA